jgi:hypothetical protein
MSLYPIETLIRKSPFYSPGRDASYLKKLRAPDRAIPAQAAIIRSVNEGKGDALPQTVLAMLQARFARLPLDLRRVLHAASVFGEIFWQGSVVALLQESGTSGNLRAWLEQLVAEEIIAPNPQSCFPSETEYRFRHALLRDAA